MQMQRKTWLPGQRGPSGNERGLPGRLLPKNKVMGIAEWADRNGVGRKAKLLPLALSAMLMAACSGEGAKDATQATVETRSAIKGVLGKIDRVATSWDADFDAEDLKDMEVTQDLGHSNEGDDYFLGRIPNAHDVAWKTVKKPYIFRVRLTDGDQSVAVCGLTEDEVKEFEGLKDLGVKENMDRLNALLNAKERKRLVDDVEIRGTWRWYTIGFDDDFNSNDLPPAVRAKMDSMVNARQPTPQPANTQNPSLADQK